MSNKMASGLPTPPMEECKPVSSSRRSAKLAKTSNRGSKKTNTSIVHEHGAVVLDGRHKRVWKACERCRMKKTKCDGESPCKRCKDDGLVCTAGSRKKTEFKQLPRGYAEVLENTQYALISTVQKLYTMVRNGESWDLGEPELNDRGLPVIHNIAEKLGCIRHSPDLPQSFPEDADDFAELQRHLYAGVSDSENKQSNDTHSPRDRTDRASSSESDHSTLSTDYTQMLWTQQQSQQQNISLAAYQQSPLTPQFDDEALFQEFDQEPPSSISDSTFDTVSIASPIFSGFQSPLQMHSPSSPWSPDGDDNMLGQTQILDLTALYMQQQQHQHIRFKEQRQQRSNLTIPRSNPANNGVGGMRQLRPGMVPGFNMRADTYIPTNDGTITPNMLDCLECNNNTSLDLVDQMDTIMFGDYEGMSLGV